MASVSALTRANADRWAVAKIKTGKRKSFDSVAKRLIGTKDRYLEISALTGVPWFVIAVIHERESSQRWDRSIAQGDPWNRKSTHVPKGRGPFSNFKEAAVDALMKCAPYAGKWTDWSAGGTMTLLEHYNGLGYANKGRPSPYIWAGTDQYAKGKYVADGQYDPNAVDQQLGCAGLILAMAALDSSVMFGGARDGIADIANDDGVASNSAAVEPAAPLPGFLAGVDPDVIGDPYLYSAQKRLKARNYSPGMVDGKWGSGSSGAISGFRNDSGLTFSMPGSLEEFYSVKDELAAELQRWEDAGRYRPVTDARANADPKVVATLAPEVVPAKRNFLAAAWASVLTFLTAAWDSVSGVVSSAWDFFTDHKDDLPSDPGILQTAWGYVQSVPSVVWILALGGLFAFIAFNSRSGVKTITESVQTGARQ